jgi:peptidoglycan/xylan/chitin deacetylase (PgdA/CDA1 family)
MAVSPALPPLALVYHGVDDVPLRRDPYGLFVAPRDLRRHISRLRSWGYRLVTFGRLATLAIEGRADGHAALTFDDGLADNLHVLAPLLEAVAADATVFVVSGWLGRPHPNAPDARILEADELATLAAVPGVEIGSHSALHENLAALSRDEAERDLALSKRELEEITGAPIEVAAYPFGLATVETAEACRRAGYRAACRISGQGSWSDPFDLPRQDMDNGSTMLALRLKRDGRYEPLMRRWPARTARSLVRRARMVAR